MENENKITQNPAENEGVTPEVQAVPEVQAAPEVQATPEIRCPKCQAVVSVGQTFCPECGTPLKKLCQNCGEELQEGQVFCAKCGHKSVQAPADPAAYNQFNGGVAVQPKKNRVPLIIGICVAVVIVLFLIGQSGGSFDFKEEFSQYKGEDWCEFASDGSYMNIDTNPDDIDSDSYLFDYDIMVEASDAVEVINSKLGFSGSLYEKMNTTTWSQGRQTDENDKFKVTWTYHPDKGLEVMYEKK